MQDWLQLQIFYNELDGSLRASLDGASIEAFMNNTYDQKPSRAKVVKENDKYQQILEKLHHLKTTVKPYINDVARSYMLYSETQLEEVNYLGNRSGNPYSNTYNLGWKDHPNLK
ncbi:hypothetical protein EPI10_015142 [Gossypium australe]|uniref:Uncharacterized protein n=1 Tax=Gossypium australe TaxID=47621 RepID=A0A5B6VJU5_9ROSI|nr:hypothetical protein EPI10_015142 [Gossypium australe]